jgi:drug/metabolite transporter (DMT)-like permease
VPTWGAIVGIILISLSLYLLSFKGRHSFKNLLSPFKNLWNNLGVRYAFLSSLPPAISIVFDREAVKASDPLTFSLLVTMFVGGSALLIDFVGQGRKKFVAQLNFPRIKSFLIGGVFYLIATSAASAALLFDISPNVSALKRLAIVFEVILGYFFLQQKEDLRRRLLAGCGVVIGAILIGLFR